MRRSGLLAIAILGSACVRLNPAYDEDEQHGGSGSSSGSTTEPADPTLVSASSGDGSTSVGSSDASGTPNPGFECEEPGFDIEFMAQNPSCPTAVAEPSGARECVWLSDWGGNTLKGTYATGCELGFCSPENALPFELKVDGLDLPTLFGPRANDKTRCAWIRLHGTPTADGTCHYDRLDVWEFPGVLRIAIGNGPPDLDPMLRRPTEIGSPIPITASFLLETDCGDPSACDRAGFRSIVVGEGMDAALPDGVPASAAVPPVGDDTDPPSYSVFNWGLQYDLSCTPWGRWAVVATAHESAFD